MYRSSRTLDQDIRVGNVFYMYNPLFSTLQMALETSPKAIVWFQDVYWNRNWANLSWWHFRRVWWFSNQSLRQIQIPKTFVCKIRTYKNSRFHSVNNFVPNIFCIRTVCYAALTTFCYICRSFKSNKLLCQIEPGAFEFPRSRPNQLTHL